jgi:cyclophilin family peptidyl-prolyl cis-trans isomerase
MAKSYNAPPPMTIDKNKTYTATIDTTAGEIKLELYPKDAPNHVNRWVFLARDGFYDGVIFHRVIPGFMIQGGDPTGTGTGGPGYKLKQEFNERSHKRGVLSMARTNDPDSAGSQFFLMHEDSPFLDRQYTAFGMITSGIETVDKIVSAPRDHSDRPKNPTKINKITIEEK